MVKALLKKMLPEKTRNSMKLEYGKFRSRVMRKFFAYDAGDLRKHLERIGISHSETVMVHANFSPDSGFRGDPIDIVNVLADHVGDSGNLLMVSIPFRGSAYDYLMGKKPFRLAKTMSMMGLITENFRRKEGVLRSFHPTHPVLAYGKDCQWIVEGHEKYLFPCGPGTPFEKFRQRHGKILFFDVGFGAITFFHYVEDLYKDRIPFPVYHDEVLTSVAYDRENTLHEIRTYVFNPNLHRSAAKVEREMERRGLIRKSRVGNSRLLLVDAEDVVRCMGDMIDAKNFPYEL